MQALAKALERKQDPLSVMTRSIVSPGWLAQTIDAFNPEPFDPFGDRLRSGIELARGGGLAEPGFPHHGSRPFGVRGAFLWVFIWSLRGTLKLRSLSFLGSDQMDNLLKAHT